MCARASHFAHAIMQIAQTLRESFTRLAIEGYVHPMRRLLKAPVVALIGVLALVPAVFVAPAAQASQIEELTLGPRICYQSAFELRVINLVPSRDNTGSGHEAISFHLFDGPREVGLNLSHRVRLVNPASFTVAGTFGSVMTANPIKMTVVSLAGNGYEEQPIASAEVYCANLPGSIVTTPANFTYTDAADVSGTLAPFVEELAGSPVTYSVIKSPSDGAINLQPDGTFTYQWGSASFVAFDVMVRNAAGQGQVLPVTLQRPLSALLVLTSSASAVTFGDQVTIAARVGDSDAEPSPVGTVTFTSEGDGQSWVEDVGVDGVATVAIEDLPVGTHTFTASYSGDSNYAASVSETITVTVAAKEKPGTGDPDCAEGESLNDEGECATAGTGGEGGEPDAGVQPKPMPDSNQKPAAIDSEKSTKTVPAQIASTGAENTVLIAGVSALTIAAGVSLVARRRRS